MHECKRGQISLEYMIVVSFVVFVVIAMLGVAVFYVSGARDKIKVSQLSTFANKIINSAEEVYFAGEPSKVTITAFLPQGVEYFEVINNSLIFNITTDSGINRVSFISNVPLDAAINLTISEGLKKLQIIAGTDRIYINQV